MMGAFSQFIGSGRFKHMPTLNWHTPFTAASKSHAAPSLQRWEWNCVSCGGLSSVHAAAHSPLPVSSFLPITLRPHVAVHPLPGTPLSPARSHCSLHSTTPLPQE